MFSGTEADMQADGGAAGGHAPGMIEIQAAPSSRQDDTAFAEFYQVGRRTCHLSLIERREDVLPPLDTAPPPHTHLAMTCSRKRWLCAHN